MRTKYPDKSLSGPQKFAQGIFDPVRLVYSLSLLGATQPMISKALGVTLRQLEFQLQRNPEFKLAYRKGREVADSKVAKALYHRATGYSHPDVHIAVVKTASGKHKVIKTNLIKHYPPDTSACIFWLKNKQPTLWRDVHKIDFIDPNAPPKGLDFSGLTDDELRMAESLGLAMKSKQAKRIGTGSTTIQATDVTIDPKPD